MNIVHIRDKALVTSEILEAMEAKLKQQSFDHMTKAFGLTNLTLEEVMSCGEGEVLNPTLVYLINQNNQSALTVTYIFG